jgi:8-oxo-dGTP pyrophosphatase MutT (NUDIX family)
MFDSEHVHRLIALTVVSDDAGLLLLVRSARRAERWELAGGAVEPGESPMDAARREVLEETRIKLGALALVGLYYGENDLLLRLAFAAMADGASTWPLNSEAMRHGEILEGGWFPRDSLPTPMPALARRMIEDSRIVGPAVLARVGDDRELIY